MIQLENLTFAYRRSLPILSAVTTSLHDGHIHGLLGGNGIGKSTLLKLVCGMLYPTAGSISVDGIESRRRERALFANLLFVPEEFELPQISLQRYVNITAPFYPDFSFEEFVRNCEQLEVSPTHRMDKLSMGQRKKGFIAFALACNTRNLLLDEPTNGLDIPSKSAFRRLLTAYALPDRCIVLSTHQVRDVENLIDNVVILDQAGIVLNATADRITDTLYFGTIDKEDEALYTDPSAFGRQGVVRNAAGSESRLSLEMLFQAAAAQREKIHALFHTNAADHE